MAKAARKAVVGKPFVKGDTRINRVKPGSGRPPDAFRIRCQELACHAQDIVEDVLNDSSDPAFLGALKWATEHGYGKPKESVEHSGTVNVNQVWSFGDKKVEF